MIQKLNILIGQGQRMTCERESKQGFLSRGLLGRVLRFEIRRRLGIKIQENDDLRGSITDDDEAQTETAIYLSLGGEGNLNTSTPRRNEHEMQTVCTVKKKKEKSQKRLETEIIGESRRKKTKMMTCSLFFIFYFVHFFNFFLIVFSFSKVRNTPL